MFQALKVDQFTQCLLSKVKRAFFYKPPAGTTIIPTKADAKPAESPYWDWRNLGKNADNPDNTIPSAPPPKLIIM